MNEDEGSENAGLPCWPFWLADAALVGTAFWVAWRGNASFQAVHAAACVVAVLAGGFLSVLPYLVNQRIQIRNQQQDALLLALSRLDQLLEVQAALASATSQGRAMQESSQKTLQACQELAEKMSAEAAAFGKFLQSAHDQERAQLRLEVEKLKRAEGDWLQVSVRTLDHVFALHAAARRSSQPELANQIGSFRAACQDAARRVGLVMFEAQNAEKFDPRGHQLADPTEIPPENAIVQETIGPGYSFQGQLLRRAVVLVEPQQGTVPDPSASEPAQPAS